MEKVDIKALVNAGNGVNKGTRCEAILKLNIGSNSEFLPLREKLNSKLASLFRGVAETRDFSEMKRITS
jgi:hypothetical protein